MAKTKSNFFTLMVFGDDAKKQIEKYSTEYKVPQYIKYKYLDASKYKDTEVKALNQLLDVTNLSNEPHIREWITNRLNALAKQSAFEFYKELTDGMYYDENGNALSEENPNGKFDTAKIGKMFSTPFTLKDGNTSYSARCSDIDWVATNTKNHRIYERTWDLVMDKKDAISDIDKKIYDAMKDKTAYLSSFGDKEWYVRYCSSYWCNAVVNDGEWHDCNTDCNGDFGKWIGSFSERFMAYNKKDDLVTIFECSKNNG